MAKLTEITGYFVRVNPEDPWLVLNNPGETDKQAEMRILQSRCEDIAKSIKRHVDDVRSAYVEVETEDTCEYCGADWTELSKTYNGGCCDDDEQNNPEHSTPDGQASEPEGEMK